MCEDWSPDVCSCIPGLGGTSCTEPESFLESCAEIQEEGLDFWGSGMYTISPDPEAGDVMDVYCDMETAGGGWTIVWASLEGESAGRPWESVGSDLGTDPRVDRIRMSWEDLRSFPHDQHIILRTGWSIDWMSSVWLAVDEPFFHEPLDETDCYASRIPDVRVWTPTHTDTTGALSETDFLQADLGFARSIDDGEACMEDTGLDPLPCGTEPDHVRKGGWYGLALSEDGHDGLTGSSCSRRQLNNDCADHLAFVYYDAHFASQTSMEPGWPATSSGCSTGSESTPRTWIGVR